MSILRKLCQTSSRSRCFDENWSFRLVVSRCCFLLSTYTWDTWCLQARAKKNSFNLFNGFKRLWNRHLTSLEILNMDENLFIGSTLGAQISPQETIVFNCFYEFCLFFWRMSNIYGDMIGINKMETQTFSTCWNAKGRHGIWSSAETHFLGVLGWWEMTSGVRKTRTRNSWENNSAHRDLSKLSPTKLNESLIGW